MTQPVLDIQQLHLSFPVLTVMFTRSTMCPCRLTAVKLSVWWENPAQVNQSPHVDYASATDGQLLRTSGQISCWEKMFLTRGKNSFVSGAAHEWR